MKTENQRAWFFVLPVLLLVAFNALVPIMTVVNYSCLLYTSDAADD